MGGCGAFKRRAPRERLSRQQRRAHSALARPARAARRLTAPDRRRDRSWPSPTPRLGGATGRTCTRSVPAATAPPSWPAPGSSRTCSSTRASASTSSSAPVSTRSHSGTPSSPSGCAVFEIDQPGPQAWKRQRLEELGHGVPERLRLIPVDFETDDDWWQIAPRLPASTRRRRSVVSSSGVSMYITKEATTATLRRARRRWLRARSS